MYTVSAIDHTSKNCMIPNCSIVYWKVVPETSTTIKG